MNPLEMHRRFPELAEKLCQGLLEVASRDLDDWEQSVAPIVDKLESDEPDKAFKLADHMEGLRVIRDSLLRMPRDPAAYRREVVFPKFVYDSHVATMEFLKLLDRGEGLIADPIE